MSRLQELIEQLYRDGKVDIEREQVSPQVKADFDKQIKKGLEKYGEPLCFDSDISGLVYAYEESLDMTHYLKLAIEQNKTLRAELKEALAQRDAAEQRCAALTLQCEANQHTINQLTTELNDIKRQQDGISNADLQELVQLKQAALQEQLRQLEASKNG